MENDIRINVQTNGAYQWPAMFPVGIPTSLVHC